MTKELQQLSSSAQCGDIHQKHDPNMAAACTTPTVPGVGSARKGKGQGANTRWKMVKPLDALRILKTLSNKNLSWHEQLAPG